MDEEVLSEIKGFANKMKVKHSELFENIKNDSKLIVDFIKQMLWIKFINLNYNNYIRII